MSLLSNEFDIILIDLQMDLCNCWEKDFLEYSNVKVVNGYFQNVGEYDCIVSPANSFGLMDGGIDLVIRDVFGMSLQNRVQEKILNEYYGE
ncbi:hypothetical protein [Aureibacter tunicatorum]|uniref:Macro domain-containing protein n=1 Tax=Aureibacter tunicatorum TaxID=866807 RepID=A0AAE4BNR5_9BACT|nr:hypothetical protein [Aureibacter tunicatorum]MDR6237114.1 hypothetical protein [Aureibacter tunicatorum]BDD06106.1 hypothetical protein AUTU_35890 [Aureibacter tunicatorum]